MPSSAVNEETDKSQYLKNNPHFRKCRSRRPGQGHQLPDWDKVDLTPVQSGDPRNPLSATHHMVFPCSRCGAKRIERYRLVVARDRKTKRYKVKHYTYLGIYWDYTGTNGYLFAGGERIAPSDTTEVDLIERIEQLALFPGAVDDESGSTRNGAGRRRAKAAPRKTPEAVKVAS